MSSLASVASVPTPQARASGAVGGRLAAAVPSLIELVGVAVAVFVLLPWFDRVAEFGSGRDQRFLDRGVFVAGLPELALPQVCDAFADLAEARVRDALCGADLRASRAQPLDAMPTGLASKLEEAARAFVVPLRNAGSRIETLRAQAQEGGRELRESADSAAAVEAEIAPFVARYRLGRGDAAGPLPLRCAASWGDAALSPRSGNVAGAAGLDAGVTSARVNAVLLLAAALDGRTAAAVLAAEARLPPVPAPSSSDCPGTIDTLATTAALMADARQSEASSRKNEAMRELARTAGTQWAAAMAIGYAFLVWSRSARRPALGVAAALAVWAAAGWLARVPWPLAGARGFVPARLETSFASAPAPFVLWLAAAGLLVLGWALARAARSTRSAPPAPQSMSSRVGYPGLVLATGIGFLLLLDLSIGGQASNRYLALYHQGHLWLAMLVLSLMVFMRRGISRGLAWAFSVIGEAAQRAARRLGGGTVGVAVVVLTAVVLLGLGFVLANMRQLTSELGRVWLIFGAAWFFFLRAGPMTERLARSGRGAVSLLRYVWPMVFVVGVLIAAMFITHDMGPLLISGYAAGAFAAAAVAMWWHHRSGQAGSAFALATLLFCCWIGGVTAALFQVGAHDAVAASRLESVAAPFASINDQLALVSWFQRAVPADGFGIAAAPWCGFSPAGACSGVPAQIHSDYTFTAIVGVFGAGLAWAISIGAAVWLHRLIRHHGRVTQGEPRLVGTQGRFANDGQALLSWISVAWVVLTSCQLAVTVAGNLAVLPLTGVTFPFVSFGMTSLLVNMAFLALCLNVDLPARERHV
jgi:cell division protein FtsW (lipid II flippase)